MPKNNTHTKADDTMAKVLAVLTSFIQAIARFIFRVGLYTRVLLFNLPVILLGLLSLIFSLLRGLLQTLRTHLPRRIHDPSQPSRLSVNLAKCKTLMLRLLTGLPAAQIHFPVSSEEASRFRRLFIGRVLNLGMPLVVAALLFFAYSALSHYRLAVKVLVDGHEVAVLESQDAYREIENTVEQYVQDITGKNYELSVQPAFQLALVNEKAISNTAYLQNTLLGKVNDALGTLYGIYVDGELFAAYPEEQPLLDLLEQLKAEALTGFENYIDAEFVNDVRVEKGIIPLDQALSLEAIDALLHRNVTEQRHYTVQSGDTLSAIALEFDTTLSVLTALNPGLDPSRLTIGQQLLVNASIPLLPVKVVTKEIYEVEVAFDTVRTKTSQLYVNQTNTVVAGKNGVDEVTVEVFYIGGLEHNRRTINRVTIKEPVTRELLVGTTPLPPTVATGVFARPLKSGTYTITARYGQSGKYWSSGYHTGLDFAAPVGTAIYAADGGKVITAGWVSSYGRLIVIDHENGYKSYYAHCNSIVVSVGERVAKGQLIGRVGMSGNASGYHCHFEIRYNGKFKNPEDYL